MIKTEVFVNTEKLSIALVNLTPITTVSHISRASSAALSTVLRTTTLTYGNLRFSGTCIAETAQPIKIKMFTIDYVSQLTRLYS